LGCYVRLVKSTPEFLEKEIARFPDWLVWHLSPCLEIYEASVRSLGDDTYRVRLVVHNTGWLPTTSPKKSLEKSWCAGCICEIELPVGNFETGKPREELGQLEGRAYKPLSRGGRVTHQDRAKGMGGTCTLLQHSQTVSRS